MGAISLRNVIKRYGLGPKANQVIHGVSAEIADGEFVVIVGPSGCGKSTLLRMVAGLEEITSGEVAIAGKVVNDKEPSERDIAMVFQNYALYPHMTVYANMAYGLKIAKVPEAEIKTRVDKAAAILELAPFLLRKPRELSGGQRQRVAMGRAIVRQPAVFLFDEPLSNLDAKLRAQTRLEIQKLHRELRTTSLFVTHDQVEAMTLAERMIVMNAGRMEQIGTPDEVYHRPATTFVAGFICCRCRRRRRAPASSCSASDPSTSSSGPTFPPPAGRCACRRSRCSAPSGWSTACSAIRSSRRASTRRCPTRRSATSSTSRPRPTTCTGSTPRPRRASAPELAAPAGARIRFVNEPWPYPRWFAHRGAGKLAPENTLAAFRVGASHGYRAFECDVKLSADGVPFLLHDATLQRTTSGHGAAAALTWNELSRLDAGAWHGRTFAGEPLPSLAGIARFCLRNGFALDIEIKPSPGNERETGRVVAAMAATLWAAAPSPPLLSSFEPAALEGARETAPRLPRALLLDSHRDGWLDEAQALGCVAVVTHYSVMDAVVLGRVHAAGMRGLVYTVNDPAEARRLDAMGIDGLVTDAVDRFSPGTGIAD
jgi:ABC-type sulfate/molybdate transport systems ATPase subunit/glycerophosphoryl diester phosphodiesterase